MADIEPTKIWWTATEIADEGLRGMPDSQRGVDMLAKRQNWRAQPGFARRREGRGGGWEYHWKLFPDSAQRQLLAALMAPREPSMPEDREGVWSWFEALPASAQDVAKARLLTLQKVEALLAQSHETKFGAVNMIARDTGVAARSIWNWFAAVEGRRTDDRLPYLAPRHRAGARRLAKVHADPEFMDLIKSSFLRHAKPTFRSVYREAVRIAAAKGIDILTEKTAKRRYRAEVSKVTEVLAREGVEAYRRYFPTQTRDKSVLAPLEGVNADFHTWDVMVRWPLEKGQEKAYVGRPLMVMFQDLFSGKLLAWRVDQSATSMAVKLAAGDMIETYGIPEHVLFDNGREFASKAITGGASSRFRFKVKEDDLPGLFTSMDCKIHWATPYSGQSKPIERAFRDLAGTVAKDPRFDGAYTGNKPTSKPEDYGSRAIDLEVFLTVIAQGIDEHNARQGRTSDIAFGRSFNDVFEEAYGKAQIRKATEAQRRFWMMGAEGLSAAKKSGLIKFEGNEYWAPWCQSIAGERIIVRFDPADYWSGLHVYSAENAYLGHVPCKAKVGFFDTDEARTLAKVKREYQKRDKAAVAAHKRYRAAELGQMLDDLPTAPMAPVEAKVVRPVFGGATPEDRRRPAPPTPQADQALAAVQAGIAADISMRAALAENEESPRERFRRALELQRAEARGEELTRDQRQWLGRYAETSEYRGEKTLHDDFGDTMFA